MTGVTPAWKAGRSTAAAALRWTRPWPSWKRSEPASPTCCRRRACGTRKGWPCAGPFRVKVADKRGRERIASVHTEAADDGDGRFLATPEAAQARAVGAGLCGGRVRTLAGRGYRRPAVRVAGGPAARHHPGAGAGVLRDAVAGLVPRRERSADGRGWRTAHAGIVAGGWVRVVVAVRGGFLGPTAEARCVARETRSSPH